MMSGSRFLARACPTTLAWVPARSAISPYVAVSP